MYCEKCGKELNDNESICSNCGWQTSYNSKNTGLKIIKYGIIPIVLVVLLIIFFLNKGINILASSIITFLICLYACVMLFLFRYLTGKGSVKKHKNDAILSTDLETYIAQLEIHPHSNKQIKYIANYLEDKLLPNEKVLGATDISSLGSHTSSVVTDKRVFFKGSGLEIINLMENIKTVKQNGYLVYVNDNFVQVPLDQVSKLTDLINKQIASTQTVKETIKIENKIVTEETVSSKIKKLSDLHDAGVLTDYEFSIKKQELLDKMR